MKIEDEIRARRKEIEVARASGDGEVGLFRILPDGKMLVLSVPYSASHLFGRLNVFGDDLQVWEHVRQRVPALAGLAHDGIPRGRVSIQGGVFTILLSGCSITADRLIERVLKEFRLTGKQVEIVADAQSESN